METNPIEVKEIIVKKNALDDIATLLKKYGFHHPMILCDQNTYEAAGKQLRGKIPSAGCIILDPKNLHADEHGVAAAEEKLSDQCDLLLAVGAGTIHDIARYISYQNRIEFFSVPTAASVDGFVSTVAAMTWEGFKKSFTAVSPLCVIADLTVIAKAPFRLTASGTADLLGKYTALTDWRISHLLTGEPICERILRMEEAAIKMVRKNLAGLREGRDKAYKALMYGLLLSGLAMQMTGNSRPASGAEHHLSHLWEMGLLNPPNGAYHGEKVGVGLVIVCEVYHAAAARMKEDSFSAGKTKETLADLLRVTKENQKLTEEMIKENTPDPLEEVLPNKLLEYRDEVISLLEALPLAEEIGGLLKEMGAPCTLEDIGLPNSIREESIRLSPYVRRRITFLRLLKLCSFYK